MRIGSTGNPFLQVLALVAFGAMALLALALGAFLFVLLLGAGLMLALVGILRGGGVRWQVRRGPAPAGRSRVIEGEYRRRER